MRFRTTGVRSQDETSYYNAGCFSAGGTPVCPVTPSGTPYVGSYSVSAMVDVSTPDFDAKSNAGELVFSPMWRESYSMTQDAAVPSMVLSNGAQVFLMDTCMIPGWTIGPPASGGLLLVDSSTTAIDNALSTFQSERDIAITKAWANVDESEMLALASLGELPETISFVASVYTRLIRVLYLFKRRKIKLMLKRKFMKPLDFADALANFWLELRYAVRPLAFELEQLQNALAASDQPKRQTARGYHKVVTIDKDESTFRPAGTYHGMTERCVITRSSNYRAGVLYSIGLDGVGLGSVFGFDQPLEAIWELTKLSFVLDWVFNFGDLLASWTPNRNLTPLGSWLVEEHVWVTTYTLSNLTYSGSWSLDDLGPNYGSGRKEMRRISRRIISPDKPVYPHIRINLDMLKIVDLVALARSIYRAIY